MRGSRLCVTAMPVPAQAPHCMLTAAQPAGKDINRFKYSSAVASGRLLALAFSQGGGNGKLLCTSGSAPSLVDHFETEATPSTGPSSTQALPPEAGWAALEAPEPESRQLRVLIVNAQISEFRFLSIMCAYRRVSQNCAAAMGLQRV